MNENDKNIELLDSSEEIQSNSDTSYTNNSTISSVQNQNISNLDSFSGPVATVNSSNISSSENINLSNSTTNRFDSSNVNVSLEGFPRQVSSTTSSSTNIDLSLQNSPKIDTESHNFHSEDDKKKDLNTSNNLNNINNSKPTKPIVFFIIFIILLLVIIFLPYIGELFDFLFPKKEDNESHNFHSEDDKKKDLNTSNNLNNINNSKPTKPIVFFIIFIILLLVIIFLPYIGELFDFLFPKKEDNVSYTGISSGSLVCTLEHENNGISYYYTDTYDFENRKIRNLQHVVSIQGGTDFLNQRNMECQTIKQTADSLPGISVDCNLSSGEMVETQYFDFSSLKNSDVSTAFIEAGGVYPNVKYGDNVSDVEKKLTISGYECRQS